MPHPHSEHPSRFRFFKSIVPVGAGPIGDVESLADFLDGPSLPDQDVRDSRLLNDRCRTTSFPATFGSPSSMATTLSDIDQKTGVTSPFKTIVC